MTVEEITRKVDKLSSVHSGKIGTTIKFLFNEGGVVLLNDSVSPPLVTNDDAPAQCTIRISVDNFTKLMDGEINAMGAYMMGKLKIDGDMSVAMKLANIF